MAQRDLTKIAVGVVLGVLGAMVVGALGVPFIGGRDTAVTLAAVENDPCTLGKETTVKAKAGRNLSWKIENYCLSDQDVSVGDFGTAEAPTESDCGAPGVSYPFESREGRLVRVTAGVMRPNGSIKPGKGEIKLKVNKHDGAAITRYHFNICLNGTPADPRLLVER